MAEGGCEPFIEYEDGDEEDTGRRDAVSAGPSLLIGQQGLDTFATSFARECLGNAINSMNHRVEEKDCKRLEIEFAEKGEDQSTVNEESRYGKFRDMEPRQDLDLLPEHVGSPEIYETSRYEQDMIMEEVKLRLEEEQKRQDHLQRDFYTSLPLTEDGGKPEEQTGKLDDCDAANGRPREGLIDDEQGLNTFATLFVRECIGNAISSISHNAKEGYSQKMETEETGVGKFALVCQRMSGDAFNIISQRAKEEEERKRLETEEKDLDTFATLFVRDCLGKALNTISQQAKEEEERKKKEMEAKKDLDAFATSFVRECIGAAMSTIRQKAKEEGERKKMEMEVAEKVEDGGNQEEQTGELDTVDVESSEIMLSDEKCLEVFAASFVRECIGIVVSRSKLKAKEEAFATSFVRGCLAIVISRSKQKAKEHRERIKIKMDDSDAVSVVSNEGPLIDEQDLEAFATLFVKECLAEVFKAISQKAREEEEQNRLESEVAEKGLDAFAASFVRECLGEALTTINQKKDGTERLQDDLGRKMFEERNKDLISKNSEIDNRIDRYKNDRTYQRPYLRKARRQGAPSSVFTHHEETYGYRWIETSSYSEDTFSHHSHNRADDEGSPTKDHDKDEKMNCFARIRKFFSGIFFDIRAAWAE